jgi:hypothetical protein
MNSRHAAVLALVGWYLMMLSACTADDSIAVPGTADVETGWYLMTAPLVPVTSGMGMEDSSAPIRFWIKVRTFPTKKECDAHRTNRQPPPETPGLRCLSADDLARAKAVHVVGWLMMTAPHDDVTAPLALWTAKSEAGLPVYKFPSEQACNEYRTCLYGGCLETGTVIAQPSMPERQWQHRKLLASRCIATDDPRLKEK